MSIKFLASCSTFIYHLNQFSLPKIVVISDTHGKHNELQLPAGDILLHAGDLTKFGDLTEIMDFLEWFKTLNFKHKIFIAGNHDFHFEMATKEELGFLIPKGVTYLNDSGATIDGINIWGSPITPRFMDMAFNRSRGETIQKHWDLIPLNTDILITHGPPAGILDRTSRNEEVGCSDLRDTLANRRIKLHVFGHIHEAYGEVIKNGTCFINASVLNLKYQLTHAPVIYEYDVES